MCIKILVVMLKKGLTRQVMMKGKEKTITCRRKQIVIGLIKSKNGGKIIIKFAAINPKSYSYCV